MSFVQQKKSDTGRMKLSGWILNNTISSTLKLYMFFIDNLKFLSFISGYLGVKLSHKNGVCIPYRGILP